MFRGYILGPGAQTKQNHASFTVSLPRAPPGRIPVSTTSASVP